MIMILMLMTTTSYSLMTEGAIGGYEDIFLEALQ